MGVFSVCRGETNKEGADKVCGRKQAGGLFSPTWARSAERDAKADGSPPKKSPMSHQTKKTPAWVSFLFAEGIRTRREQTKCCKRVMRLYF